MPNDSPHTFARVLAPLALVVCAVAVFAVILSAGSNGNGDGGTAPAATQTATSPRTTGGERKRRRGNTYTVKTGDTLGTIAETTGVSVEQLQELNPELDPQALVSGQKIKLRE
jgi:LysM repeat protein